MRGRGQRGGRLLSPSWSAKADHPRVFVFFKRLKNKTKRGWSAFADHDDRRKAAFADRDD
jgi:hypothetical protein